MARKNLYQLAMEHQPAILAHQGLADPTNHDMIIPLAGGPARLRRQAAAILLEIPGCPRSVTLWRLDHRTSKWQHHRHAHARYRSWSEYARTWHQAQHNHPKEPRHATA